MAFVPLPGAVGEMQQLRGDFSKALYYRMQPSHMVEDRIGYRKGRLRDGWWLMFLLEMPTVQQFEYRGYSHLPGGIAQGHLPAHADDPNVEQRMRAAGVNLSGNSMQQIGLKQRTIAETFRLDGPWRIAKVRPVAAEHGDPDEPDYPPGLGIPQWTLTTPLRWVAAAFVPPGGQYLGNYETPARRQP